MNTSNMPSQGGAGGRPMATKRAECDIVVYGKGGSFSGDIDGDGVVDGLPSGAPKIFWVDSSQPKAVLIWLRSGISVVWHQWPWALGVFFFSLGFIPFAYMGLLATASSSARQLTPSEGGGWSGALGNNLAVNAKSAISSPATALYGEAITSNLKSNSEIATLSPREQRSARR